MKKLFYLLPALALIWACGGNGTGGSMSGGNVSLASFSDSASYAQGMMMGQQIKSFQMEGEAPLMDPEFFAAGMKAAMNDSEALITEDAIRPIMMKFQMSLQQAQQKKAQIEGAAARAKGTEFLAENAKKEGVKTTASGLQYIVVREGTGAAPTTADEVEVDYEGKLLNGEVFDSSYKRGKPISFAVTGVIRGWTEGLQLMKEGAKFQFFIPADIAYGDQGSPPKIGPGETLIFDVELHKVNP